MPLPPHVRLLELEGDLAFHQAVAEVTLRLSPDPIVGFSRVFPPLTLSIGYFQPAADVPQGRPFVRRLTGGGLVDHIDHLAIGLLTPTDHPLTQAKTLDVHRQVSPAFLAALKTLGLNPTLVPLPETPPSPRSTYGICFDNRVPGDLLLNGEKLSGSARHTNNKGSIHLTSLNLKLLPTISEPELRKALTETLTPLIGQTLIPTPLTPLEAQEVERLTQERYRSHDWNHAR